MEISARTMLTAGVAALTAGALVFAPNVRPASMRNAEVIRPVSFAADMAPLPPPGPVPPLTEEDLESALALLDQLGEISGHGAVTVKPGSHRSGARSGVTTEPAETVIATPSATDRTVAPAAAVPGGAGVDDDLAEPGQLNAASDLIDNVYDVTRYWANYVSLELGPWLINWVPFGYLVSDQIYIWYPDFVLPVVDSFVYDFLDPVVNNPLNLQVWLDGIGAILNTAFNGVVDGINDEIDYVLSFGWFPIPLPPLPDFPLPGAASTADAVDVALAASALASAEDAASDKTDKADKTDQGSEKGTEKGTDQATDKGTGEDGSTDTSGEAGEAPSDPAGDEGSTEPTEPAEPTESTDATDEATDQSTDGGSEQAPPENTEQETPQDTEAPAAQDDGTGSEDTTGSGDTTGSEDTVTDPGPDDEADADAEAADAAAAQEAAEQAAAEAELEDTGGTNGDAQDGAASSTGSGADTGTGSGTDAGADTETDTVTVGGDSGSESGD